MPRGPEPKKPRPSWSTALRARRVALDLRQEDVAARTEDAISQGTVSDLERGKVDIANLTATRLGLLAQALDWSINELQAALGVKLTSQEPAGQIAPFLEDNFPGILSTPSTPPPPRLRPLPEELTQMIDEKGHLAEELLTERWQQYLAGQRFSTGRATPERWWNLFLLLKNAGVEPGGN